VTISVQYTNFADPDVAQQEREREREETVSAYHRTQIVPKLRGRI